MCVTANNNWLGPARNKAWNVAANNWLAEYNATQDVADGAVWRLPHFLQFEFFNACFVGGNGCALHANAMLQDGICGIDGDLVVGLVAVFHTKVVVLKFNIEVRQDQTIFDELPDDAGHLVAVELDDWIVNFDLRHDATFQELPTWADWELVRYLYTLASPRRLGRLQTRTIGEWNLPGPKSN